MELIKLRPHERPNLLTNMYISVHYLIACKIHSFYNKRDNIKQMISLYNRTLDRLLKKKLIVIHYSSFQNNNRTKNVTCTD